MENNHSYSYQELSESDKKKADKLIVIAQSETIAQTKKILRAAMSDLDYRVFIQGHPPDSQGHQ